jgi:hypothetical protein
MLKVGVCRKSGDESHPLDDQKREHRIDAVTMLRGLLSSNIAASFRRSSGCVKPVPIAHPVIKTGNLQARYERFLMPAIGRRRLARRLKCRDPF